MIFLLYLIIRPEARVICIFTRLWELILRQVSASGIQRKARVRFKVGHQTKCLLFVVDRRIFPVPASGAEFAAVAESLAEEWMADTEIHDEALVVQRFFNDLGMPEQQPFRQRQAQGAEL